LRKALLLRINIAGEWRGFNRSDRRKRELLRNQACFGLVRAVPAVTKGATRASMPHLEWRSAGGMGADFRIRIAVPQCTNWHIKCLAGNGRWWPGTFVETCRLRFPTFRIINS
jgi:hypothetical protein